MSSRICAAAKATKGHTPFAVPHLMLFPSCAPSSPFHLLQANRLTLRRSSRSGGDGTAYFICQQPEQHGCK